MSRKSKRYLSYLIRLWQENGENRSWHPPAVAKKSDLPIWRASLQRSGTHARVGFASLDELFAFLQQETGTAESGAKEEDDAGQRRATAARWLVTQAYRMSAASVKESSSRVLRVMVEFATETMGLPRVIHPLSERAR